MKKVVVHYSSSRNTTFPGTAEVYQLNDDEYADWLSGGEVPEDYLIEFAQEWIRENVAAWAEVVDA